MIKIIRLSLLNALATSAYIILIASSLFYIPKISGLDKSPDTVFAPIVMLSLLVFSVAIVGSLIFGRPILWYLDGKKEEAIRLLFATLVIFFVITAIAICALFYFR